MVLVQGSCHCHFPSSAAAITWQLSAESIHCDKTALCLHTKFNRGSPHLRHRGVEGGFAGDQGVYSGWGGGWKEVWRKKGSENGKFCQ